ncbi:MAG: peptidoglycan-binding protein [Burkholderiaceae bacterium]
MIELGCFDPDIADADCAAYAREVETLTRVPLAKVQPGLDKWVARRQPPSGPGAMNVRQVQQALRDIGFFPGGRDDGIFGYRTLSAVRLFQEYVRSVEKLACAPDGRFGPQSQAHLQRWLDQRLVSTWSAAIDAWRAGTPSTDEFAAWLNGLEAVKAARLAAPGALLQQVNEFKGTNDTRKVAEWDFAAPGNIHLVGVRRQEFTGRFDDVFVLLLKGLVFKFQGSTEPGSSSHPKGPPYLVPGQHDYHFGWHRSTYLALRPSGNGVLVVRAGADKTLDDADLNAGLEANPTINIHWGGRGMEGMVNNWSEGCQVINGSVYIGADDQLVSCAEYAATRSTDPTTRPDKTRGAYNVLLDLVTALGSDIPGSAVKYTLLTEGDLALAPGLAQRLTDARQQVLEQLTR